MQGIWLGGGKQKCGKLTTEWTSYENKRRGERPMIRWRDALVENYGIQ